jgi:hypothetical protein
MVPSLDCVIAGESLQICIGKNQPCFYIHLHPIMKIQTNLQTSIVMGNSNSSYMVREVPAQGRVTMILIPSQEWPGNGTLPLHFILGQRIRIPIGIQT